MEKSEALKKLREQFGDDVKVTSIPRKIEIDGVTIMLSPEMPDKSAIVSPAVMLRLVELADVLVENGSMSVHEGVAH